LHGGGGSREAQFVHIGPGGRNKESLGTLACGRAGSAGLTRSRAAAIHRFAQELMNGAQTWLGGVARVSHSRDCQRGDPAGKENFVSKIRRRTGALGDLGRAGREVGEKHEAEARCPARGDENRAHLVEGTSRPAARSMVTSSHARLRKSPLEKSARGSGDGGCKSCSSRFRAGVLRAFPPRADSRAGEARRDRQLLRRPQGGRR